MKKLLLVTIFIIGGYFFSSAQVTKVDVLQMMKEVGATEASIESFYIGNTLTFYTDGNWKKTYEKYKKTNQNYSNMFFVTDSGILLKTKKDGKLVSLKLYPYKAMNNFYVSKNAFEIYLKD